MLLLKQRPSAAPQETAIVIPGGGVGAVAIACGQMLSVTDIGGGQPAALFAVDAHDPGQFVSPQQTRAMARSFLLRPGLSLMTNRCRAALALCRDSVGHHDLLMPMTEAGEHIHAEGGARRLRTRLRSAFATIGPTPAWIGDPVNLFLHVGIAENGALTPLGVASTAGDAVMFRAVMDLTVVIAAPLPDHTLWRKPAAGSIAVTVHNLP